MFGVGRERRKKRRDWFARLYLNRIPGIENRPAIGSVASKTGRPFPLRIVSQTQSSSLENLPFGSHLIHYILRQLESTRYPCQAYPLSSSYVYK